MIDIYDEIGYIDNILENGLSNKWERDVVLLTRYYKLNNVKKSTAKNLILDKCREASERKENPIYYNHLIEYKKLNKIFDGAWKKKTPLRNIQCVEISQEVLDWFLNLENDYCIDNEKEKYVISRKRGVRFKQGHPINWNRTKFLFTLYIWSLIQSEYLERPNIHYLSNCKTRFKEDANLPASFILQKERDFLYDLDFIQINFALGIEASFIEKFDVFKIPVTDDNRIIIVTGEPSDGDLYHPGLWLDKQKMGSFVCQKCGKEFPHYNNSPREKARKYCKECGKYNKMKYREMACIDCGKIFLVDSKNNRTVRCEECQKKHILEYDRIRKNGFKEVEEIKKTE